MKSDQEYIKELESIISKIMPYYIKYFNLTGKQIPELLIPKHIKPNKPLPALLSGDFRCLPQTDEGQEKNQTS